MVSRRTAILTSRYKQIDIHDVLKLFLQNKRSNRLHKEQQEYNILWIFPGYSDPYTCDYAKVALMIKVAPR